MARDGGGLLRERRCYSRVTGLRGMEVTRKQRTDELKRSKMKENMLDFQSTTFLSSTWVENQIKLMLVQ